MQPQKSVKVLVVDDSKMIHTLVKRALAAHEVQIVDAFNGHEGCILAVTEMPDVIFLDINMPQVDGERALAALKKVERTANIPVVLMTAVTDAQTQERAFDAGVIKYLPKPAKEEMILSMLETIIELPKKAA